MKGSGLAVLVPAALPQSGCSLQGEAVLKLLPPSFTLDSAPAWPGGIISLLCPAQAQQSSFPPEAVVWSPPARSTSGIRSMEMPGPVMVQLGFVSGPPCLWIMFGFPNFTAETSASPGGAQVKAGV